MATATAQNVMVGGKCRLIAYCDNRGRVVVDVPHGLYRATETPGGGMDLTGPSNAETVYSLRPDVVRGAFDDYRLSNWP